MDLVGGQEVADERRRVSRATLAIDPQLHLVVEVAVGDLGGGDALDLDVHADLLELFLDEGRGLDISVLGANGEDDVEAVGIAGLGEQGLRLLHVICGNERFLLLIVAPGDLRHGQDRQLAVAVRVDAVDESLAVDCSREGQAHLVVGQDGVGEVEADVGKTRLGVLGEHELVARRNLLDELARNVEGDVDFARGQRVHSLSVLGDDVVLNAVEVRLDAPVLVELRELRRLVGGMLVDFERAGRDGMHAEFLAPAFDFLFRDHKDGG